MQPLVLLISAGDIQHRRIGGALLLAENKTAIRCTQQAVGSGNHIEFVICLQLAGVVNDYHRHLVAVGNGFQPGHNIVVATVAVICAASLTNPFQGVDDNQAGVGMLPHKAANLILQTAVGCFTVGGKIQIFCRLSAEHPEQSPL